MSVILRYRKLKNGSKSYYLDISHNGERYREFLNAKINGRLNKKIGKSKKEGRVDKIDKSHNDEIKRLAMAIRNERERELITQGSNVSDIKKRNICFTTFFEEYDNNYDKADFRKIHSAFLKFEKFFGKIKAGRLNHDICLKYLEFLRSNDKIKSDETVRSYFGVFRKIIHQAEIRGILKEDPTRNIRVKKIERKLTKQVLEIEEIAKLYNTSCGNEEVKRAFLFCLNTGLGLAELRKLKWKHINNNKLSHFSRAKTDSSLVIPLNEDAISCLGKRRNISEFVFPNLPSNNGCNKTLKNWVKRAGIDKHITWYCSRHSFACNLLIHGANTKTVSQLLGHSSAQVVDRYLKHVDSLKIEAVNAIPSVTKTA